MTEQERLHFALLGDPVHHSLSPGLHNAWFDDLGADATYLCLTYNGTGEELAKSLIALRLSGCNLTTPLKEKILPHLASCGPDAIRSGAVNTVCVRDGDLHGYNTDVAGFKDSLGVHGPKLRGRAVLIAGAGGAARAVAIACADLGATEIVFTNRTLQRAQTLAQTMSATLPSVRWSAMSMETGTLDASRVFLFVDATRAPQPPEKLQKLIQKTKTPCICFDLNYWRKSSVWSSIQTQQGLTFFDGRDMLLQQAVHAFRLFTGAEPDISIGRAVLAGAIPPAPDTGTSHG